MILFREGLKKCVESFGSLDKIPKLLIRFGIRAFTLILLIGTATLIYNRFWGSVDPYIDFVGNMLIKNSFTLLLEFVAGAIAMDFVVGSKKMK